MEGNILKDENAGIISANCYMVQRGKPAALISIHKDEVEEAIEFINSHNLKALVREDNGEEWKSLWIFKYDHILTVIESLPVGCPQNPYEHWILGKLFGYDEHSIEKFINK